MRPALCLLAVVALLAGCDASTDLDPVEGDLTVTLPVRYDDQAADGPPPFVVVATTGTYPCPYQLVVDARATSRQLTVEAEGARMPEVCGSVIAPATAQVALPAGAGDGYRIVVVRPNGRRSTFVLTLTRGLYAVVPAPESR